MKHQHLPDVFEHQLRMKYHSAKLDQIKTRKHSKQLSATKEPSTRRYSSRKTLVTLQDKLLAMENLQLIKRLAEVRYGKAEITKLWSGETQSIPKRRHQNVMVEHERIMENDRLGKTIEVIGKRKKHKIMPHQ